jgi:hypothetical protein
MALAALGIVLVTFGAIGVLVMPLELVVFWGLLGLVVALAVWKAAITFPSVQQLIERGVSGDRRPGHRG